MAGDPPMSNPVNTDQTALQETHNELFGSIEQEMDESKFRAFKTMVGACLSKKKLKDKDTAAILRDLELADWITVGNYENLRTLLHEAKLKKLSKQLPQVVKEAKIPKRIEESKLSHCKLYVHVHDHLTEGMAEYESFIVITRTCLNYGTLAKKRDNILDILDVLETESWIDCGNYENLITILEDAGILAQAEEIRKSQEEIQRAMKNENPQMSLPTCSKIPERLRHHYTLYEHVNRSLPKTEYNSFMTIARGYLDDKTLKENIENIVDVLCALERKRKIGVGNYENLMTILRGAHLFKLEGEVKDRADKMPKEVPAPVPAPDAAGYSDGQP